MLEEEAELGGMTYFLVKRLFILLFYGCFVDLVFGDYDFFCCLILLLLGRQCQARHVSSMSVRGENQGCCLQENENARWNLLL